jgi:hypothetical protein
MGMSRYHVYINDTRRVSRARFALNTWTLYRRAGCGLRECFRNALRAWRQRV